ncbi:MAG: glycosyltransferase family 2 protein [Verrucomicrobia bacterium]|nr:glycosyltransferase family 2 protein [Verrucomicrobiota bacterium]
MDAQRLSLIVPAFNEERTIESVLDRVFEFLPDVHEVLVIDDASADRTPEVCHAYTLREERVKLYRHRRNQGKTAALQTGFAACTGSIVVVQDADLEYDPREIPDLIAPIMEGSADVCLGSRFMVRRAGRVLYYRHFLANKLLTLINNLCTDLNLTDVETGYKASRADIPKNMIIESSGFGFEIEFVAKCKKIGARIYEVPISYYGRTYEEGKKIGLRDGLDAFWYLIRFNVLTGLKESFRPAFLQEKSYPKRFVCEAMPMALSRGEESGAPGARPVQTGVAGVQESGVQLGPGRVEGKFGIK